MNESIPEVVTGRRVVLTHRGRRWLAAYVVWVVVYGGFLIAERRWTSVVLMAALLVFAAVRRSRPPTTVNGVGISRPWRRASFLPWALIDHVLQPGHELSVRVVTTTGRTIRLNDIEAAMTARVAEIGGRPVKAEVVPVPRPIERERTQREVEADVARRAARLAEERRGMSGSA